MNTEKNNVATALKKIVAELNAKISEAKLLGLTVEIENNTSCSQSQATAITVAVKEVTLY